ncbi:MAG: hypothetical protein A2X82_05840 [Geobacteraceae bacterium GWC2_55_20]|nr:MAG: hypothetical protein A2X82_05840 [Geobacteraceae bacterium GWC2_55_20]OGU26079.1 MAG: hypothetical protein A2X85_09240 [Geobacteraceae bacterium GWF2_54_21]HCE66583.1 hypothetical protein [Geobacter sp.]
MISVVVYGRNDSHGYNLPKRAAISINCIAEVLDDKDDEIIFVDCNTPNDIPTFPESISDTLTPAAKQILRVLRLRPEQYSRHCGNDSKFKVQESLCRNVAIRRSNPNNRWILNTNTDMVFAPLEEGNTLSRIASELQDGFYELPRFEVPESLWESVNRTDPLEIIRSFSHWGLRLHLNEIVTSSKEALFDQQGDFQLSLRSQLFQIHGMDEKMAMWAHVDTNLCKRMWLLSGQPNTILDKIYAFHCDHTRNHSAGASVTNDNKEFVENVTTPYCTDQADSWGMVSEIIEEIRLDKNHELRISQALEKILPGMDAPIANSVVGCNYIDTNLYYDDFHVFPYLADIVANLPPSSSVGYLGNNANLLKMLVSYRSMLNHTGCINYHVPILQWMKNCATNEQPSICQADNSNNNFSQSDAFVVDFSMKNLSFRQLDGLNIPAKCKENEVFARAISAEIIKLARDEKQLIEKRHLPRNFIFVGCHTTSFDYLVKSLFSCGNTPLSTCIRSGVLSSEAFNTTVFMPFHYYVIGFSKSDYAEWISERIGKPVSIDDLKLADELYNIFVTDPNRQRALRAFEALADSDAGWGKLLLQIEIAETDGMPEQAAVLRDFIHHYVPQRIMIN